MLSFCLSEWFLKQFVLAMDWPSVLICLRKLYWIATIATPKMYPLGNKIMDAPMKESVDILIGFF